MKTIEVYIENYQIIHSKIWYIETKLSNCILKTIKIFNQNIKMYKSKISNLQ